MTENNYAQIIVESYIPQDSKGLHGLVHIRPLPGQSPYTSDMHVECSKVLSDDYPVGTKFIINGKITNMEGGKPFIYSHYLWPYRVLKD